MHSRITLIISSGSSLDLSLHHKINFLTYAYNLNKQNIFLTVSYHKKKSTSLLLIILTTDFHWGKNKSKYN